MTKPVDPYRSVAARVRGVFRKSGIPYATSYASRVRGFKNWTEGVTVDKCRDGFPRITPRADFHDVRERDLARAVTALREAGWTVTDGGVIMTAPEPEPRSPKPRNPKSRREP